MEAPSGGNYRIPAILAVDLARLDSQHDEIFRHIHQLYALRIGGTGELRRNLLERLLALAQENFAAEERLLEATAYPLLADHRDSHRQIAAALRQLRGALAKGKRPAQDDVADAMAPMLVHHLKDDGIFRDFMPDRPGAAP